MIRSKPFGIGFLVGLFGWGLIVVALKEAPQIISDCQSIGDSTGFPFYYVEECNNPTFRRFIWLGLIADILFVVALSSFVGFIFRFIWGKIAPKS